MDVIPVSPPDGGNANEPACPALLITSPVPKSYLYKYLMALMPAMLVIISIFLRDLLKGMFATASSLTTSMISSAIPGNMNPIAASMNQYSAGMTDITSITILFIAPVGLFIIFASIGWAMRLTEMWTGCVLTIVFSAITGFVLAHDASSTGFSSAYLLTLLQWIAFLVQPFSVLAILISIGWTEKFRRSVRYTITREGIWIKGGIFKVQEHMIPHHQIGRIVLEQDFFGARYNYGTIIPQTITRWGAETAIRGFGASGQKDTMGLLVGYARGREEASRYPLDCLYGISNPQQAQRLLENLICRPTRMDEAKITYLKKIYEQGFSGSLAQDDGDAQHQISQSEDHAAMSPGSILPGNEGNPGDMDPVVHTSPVIRLCEEDFPESYACVVCGKKEIPPYTGNDGKTYCSDHYPKKREG
jgi:hypothetical protein